MKRLPSVFVLLTACAFAATPAQAQTFPSKPVKVIAGSAAGGLSDVFMRALGEELHKRWGQPMIIENRPGGGFNIALRACADAAPDGHTVCLVPSEAIAYNLHLYPNLPFSIEKDITPVTNLFFIVQSLGSGADTNVKSLSEMVPYAKARPKTLSYVAPSAALSLFMDNFNREHGIDLVRVPFKGGGDAINGVLSGVTPFAFLGTSNMIAHFRSGKMNPLLFDTAKRWDQMPDVPTITEIGYRGPVTRSYFGFLAPSATPKPILEKIAADVRAIASEPAFRDKNLIQRGLEPVFDTPDQFAAYVKEDRVRSKKVVEDAGLKQQ